MRQGSLLKMRHSRARLCTIHASFADRYVHNGVRQWTPGAIILAMSLAGGCCAVVQAQPFADQLQAAQRGVRRQALRARPFIRIDGQIVLTGDWVPLSPGASRTHYTAAFDCIELQMTGGAIGEPTGGIECNVGGGLATPTSRWYFGDLYSNPFTSADMTTAAPAAGRVCDTIAFAWFWNVAENEPDNDADGRPDSLCYVAVQTFEDMDVDCGMTPPPEPQDDGSNAYEGVLFDFGFVNRNAGGGQDYYWTVLDSPIGIQMPVDGVGGYQMIFGRGFDQFGELVRPLGIDEILHTGVAVQPMLWGTGDAEPAPDGRVGTQLPGQYDDNNPTNGVHDYDEQIHSALECY